MKFSPYLLHLTAFSSFPFLFFGIALCCASILITACSPEDKDKTSQWNHAIIEQSELDAKSDTDANNNPYLNAEIPAVAFELAKHVPVSLHDSLLTDLIVLIYKRPPGSNPITRFESRFRSWYTDQLPQFDWMAHQVNNDWHYFLIQRPARNIHGHVRTVGGKFKLNYNYSITDFREIFNTPMLPDNEARVKGALIFNQLMEEGYLGHYYLNSSYIEFPNSDCFYDTASKEWSYDLSKRAEQPYDYTLTPVK